MLEVKAENIINRWNGQEWVNIHAGEISQEPYGYSRLPPGETKSGEIDTADLAPGLYYLVKGLQIELMYESEGTTLAVPFEVK